MDLIRIRGLEIDCIVGVRPLEREREQRVHLELALGLDLAPAGRSGRIALTCDYDQVATEVISMLRFRRYHLIEMATEEVAAMLLAVHPALESVDIRLDKPAALDGRARAASVEIRRQRSAFPVASTAKAYGAVDLVLETREARLMRLRVSPGASLPQSAPLGVPVLEWLVSGELTRNGAAMEPHVPTARSAEDEPGPYENQGHGESVLFRCVGANVAS